MQYDYPTAFKDWGREEIDALDRVIASGSHTMGEEVEAFEHEFAAFQGARHAIMVNSGSSANLIMVAALCHMQDRPLKRGDQVAVPAIAWSTTYAPLVQYGLEPVLLDVGPDWCADAYSKRMDPQNARLVVGCSILGSPTDSEAWASVAGVLDAHYVEDNCESLGSIDVTGHRTGTRGLMNTFSFFYSHQISAIEGGMVTTDSEECADLCRMLRAHGWTRDLVKTRSFHKDYSFILMGYNVRPTEMHAAVARVQLKRMPELTKWRRKNLETFRLLTSDLPVCPPASRGTPDPFGIAFTVASPTAREKLVFALRSNSIDCRLPTGGSFRKHPYAIRWFDQATPEADEIHECGMFLGNGPVDLTEKIERAVSVMRGVL